MGVFGSPLMSMSLVPIQIDPYSPSEIQIRWNSGEHFIVPYSEIRFACPCAGCVDEHTGVRTLEKTSIRPDIKPVQVGSVGRYAIQFVWNDRHDTGMYHFDRLYEICKKTGLTKQANESLQNEALQSELDQLR